MQRGRFLAKCSIAILVPIALGATYAVATSSDPGRTVGMADAPIAIESTTTTLHAAVAAHRIARAKCVRLVGVDRGNCRTEARAEARRVLKTAQPGAPA